MNRIFLLFILSIYSTGFCGDSKVALDITNVNSSSIDTRVRRPHCIDQTIYQARNGYRITSVRDGEVTIWSSSDTHSCEHVVVVFDKKGAPTFTLVYTRGGDGIKRGLYYLKENGWVSTTEEEFYKRFHNLVIRESFTRTFVLETAKKYTYREFYVNNSPKFPFLVYAANTIARLKEVRYEGSVVWKAQNDYDSCVYASFYPRENAKVAYLIVHGYDEREDLYFHNFYGLWIRITRELYLEELKNEGFKESEFDDRVTLDLSNVDMKQFHMHTYVIHGNYTRLHTPLPGYRLTRVVIANTLVWEAGKGERCIYLNSVTENTTPLGLFMFIADSMDNSKILYLKKEESGWVKAKREDFYSVVVNDNSPIYTHNVDNQKIVMSSFRNKQGLRLTSYASKVENAKGDIILIHGFRSFFMSEFSAFNLNWNHDHLNFPGFPHICTVGTCEKPRGTRYVSKYRTLFECGFLEGKDVFELSPRYEYDYSVVYFLNRLGYNVYGLDLQSQGLSSAVKSFKCYANDFKDHVYDLLQFVSIVKRGKFEDSSQVYDEKSIFENVECDRKLFLLGFSMGGNISIQAVHEFYKHAEKGARFIDGLIGLSAMLNIDCHIRDWKKALASKLLKYIVAIVPDTKNPFEFLLNYGESFDFFIRYKDPFHYSGATTFKTINALFRACKNLEVPGSIKHYPKDLPTLFLHSKEDFMSGIKGPREFLKIHFKGKENAKLIEFNDTSHYLTVYQSMSTVMPCIWRWLNGLSGNVAATGDNTPTYNEL